MFSQSPSIAASLHPTRRASRSRLGVIGTPNFFIQGKLVKSVISIKEIREMVDPLLAGQTATPR